MQLMRKRVINFYGNSIIVVLFLLTAGALSAFSQTLRGKVVDSRTQEPIIGAVISEKSDKGGAAGTVTDVDGNFQIRVKSFPATLVVSYTGYNNKEVDVYELTDDEIQVDLTENFNVLDGVVIVGYGTQKKSELSGAVSSVSLGDINKGVVASVNGLLDGAAAGLQATSTGGQPGAGVSIRIRGGSSVQGGNEPLYVIDGFPVYNENISSGAIASDVSSGISAVSNDPLASLNPGDIESVTVLKDASATAIYGSRGANGVIIITTRKGKNGEKAHLTYNGSVGWQQLRKKYGVLDGRQFAELRNDALYDGNPAAGHFQYMSQEAIDALGNGTDWQDAAYRSALVTNHQLSVSGGTDKTRYAFTGSYFRQDGILSNTGFDRFSARVNIDTQLSDKFKAGMNVTGSKTDSKTAPSDAVFALLQIPATATIYDSDGRYTYHNPFDVLLSNPIASLNEQTNKSRTYRFLGTAFGEYEFIKNLKLKVLAGADVHSTKDYYYVPSTLYEGNANKGIASLGNTDVRSWLNENTLSYAFTINKVHSFDLLAGFTQQNTKYEIVTAGASDFVTDKLTYNNLAGGSVTATPTSNTASNSLISWIGRVNYNYADRHSLSLSLRRDGSSRFGKDRKWGTFPSVGYSWNAGNESFFKQIKSTVSSLKLRLSYGKTGNQEIGNYQALSTLSSHIYTFNGKTAVGYTPDRLANSGLGWETTYQFDLGLDFGFLKDRITFTVDYYHKKTDDLLMNVSLPYTTGFSSSLQNYGTVVNQGLEFSVNAEILKGQLTWNLNGNLSLNRNKVTDLGGNSTSYITSDYYTSYIIKEGQPLGTFYGARYEGVLQSGEEATKGALTYNQTGKAGDRIYKDISNDGKFTNAEDRTVIGNAEPDFTFAVTNNFTYKGFDLSFLINGSVGNDIANINRERLSLFTGYQNAVSEAADRWTPDNPHTSVSRAKYSDPATVFSSEFIEDGSFVRLKNITLGYTFGKPVTSWLHISGLRLYFSATNLLTITGYTGYDPEVTSVDNALTAGTDYGAYPSAKTFSFGATINF